jgi:hypothetical protein
MLTTKSMICFCVVGIALTVSYTVSTSKPAERAGGAEPKQQVVGVTVRLDKQEACPGETVRMTEVVPATDDVVVFGTGHTAYRIGDYDRKLGRLVNREPDRILRVFIEVFDGIPGAEVGSGTKEITVRNPREKGFEFEFKPKLLGIYMIVAYWRLKDGTKGGSFLYGQPVILVVKPPLDAKGQLVVKDEWFP